MMPEGPSSQIRQLATGNRQSLPPGGKVSPKATDEGVPRPEAAGNREPVGDDDAARGGHRPEQTPGFPTLREDGG